MIRSRRLLAGAGVILAFFMGEPAGAQDLPVQLTGRMDSSYTWMEEPLPDGGQTLGVVGGWAGLVGGTKDVRSEVRVGYTSFPSAALALNRAWLKFRLPGVRFTTGLGRLAWGTGFVLVPGDLLFDSVGTGVDFSGDELRSQGAWLGDAWVSLGDEAFFEAAALKDSAGARFSAAPGGVTVEAAGAWDRTTHTAKAALSTQFHAELDWYATLRQDWDTEAPAWDPERGRAAAGAFGLWSPAEGLGVSTRHEVLVAGDRPREPRSYHEASLTFEGGWSVTARLLGDVFQEGWTPGVDLRWAPLQNLALSASATLRSPVALRLGAASKW